MILNFDSEISLKIASPSKIKMADSIIDEKLSTFGSEGIKKYIRAHVPGIKEEELNRWHEHLVLNQRISNIEELRQIFELGLFVNFKIPAGILLKLANGFLG